MSTPPAGDPKQLWEAASRSFTDGLRQAQEFWGKAAQNWGDATGAWLGQLNRSSQAPSGDDAAILRELQEAAFAVGQAWMRLPLVLAGGAQPRELQDAVLRLTEAQGRAYKLWMEAITRAARGPGQRF